MARTPLHAFGIEHRLDEYKSLIDSGEYDVNAQDADAKTPLHYATEQFVTPAVMWLLHAGANPNLQETRWGNTPLSNAIFYMAELGPEVTELMIANGGDPTIVNYTNTSPLKLAQQLADQPGMAQMLPILTAAAP